MDEGEDEGDVCVGDWVGEDLVIEGWTEGWTDREGGLGRRCGLDLEGKGWEGRGGN